MKPDLKSLDRCITDYCQKNQIFGVLRITVADEILYQTQFGYANAEKQLAFIPNSMFSFYSLSKPFCAIGLMKLWEQGKLNLTDHPSRYVLQAAGFDERVQIGHLLRHISGLPDFELTPAFVQQHKEGNEKPIREELQMLSHYPSLFPPATKGMYANINFLLCALIIEAISDMPYAEYMKREVFLPLEMPHAVVDHRGLEISHRVQGYGLDANGDPVPVAKSYDWMLGAGDMVGTVEDVYCLNKAIKHRLLLQDDTWNEILTPSPLNQMGMGCTVTEWHGQKRIHHNGGSTGFRTLHVFLPQQDFDLIILSNSGYGNARGELSEMVYDAFFETNDTIQKKFEMDTGYI